MIFIGRASSQDADGMTFPWRAEVAIRVPRYWSGAADGMVYPVRAQA